jgi:hypothetical protein
MKPCLRNIARPSCGIKAAGCCDEGRSFYDERPFNYHGCLSGKPARIRSRSRSFCYGATSRPRSLLNPPKCSRLRSPSLPCDTILSSPEGGG